MSNTKHITIVLAAGLGKRMKSDKIKVLHRVLDKTIISYVFDIISKTNPFRSVFVVGNQAEEVKKELKNKAVEFAYQNEQLGTGHAVMCTRELLMSFSGDLVIVPGDCPLISPETILQLLDRHRNDKNQITVLTATLPYYPKGYGRIVCDKNGKIKKIVEEKDANEQELQIHLVNSGIYCADSSFLFSALENVKNNNAQNEYYLPDVIEIAANKSKCGQLQAKDYREILGVNTQEELKLLENILIEKKRSNL